MSRLAPVRPLAAAVVLLAAAGFARADMFTIEGGGTSSHPSSFSGSISVTKESATSAWIEIRLTNTSESTRRYNADDGYITGFAFNDPALKSLNIEKVDSFSSSNDKFKLLGVNGSGSVLNNSLDIGSIYGKYDIGASIGNTLHTSGDYEDGIAAGQEAWFKFLVSGAGIGNLTAEDLLDTLSSQGSDKQEFIVRFRGYNTSKLPYGGDGDKVPVTYSKEVYCEPNPVPAPPGLVLAGMGVGGLLLGRLRPRRAA